MSMKEILVHLDNTDRCQTRLDVAISLTLTHQAHLTGVMRLLHLIMLSTGSILRPR